MKDFIKRLYGSVAAGKKKKCCGPDICSSGAGEVSKKVGYTKEELESIPEEANMGLGCGNPVAIASLKEGETVVDFGSGGGIDAFLAAKRVGDKGRVIGIDMTEEMIEKANNNVERAGLKNVEFKLGDIEAIPLENDIADCVISNCVINLAQDKQKVFNEAFRILKPGGRIMVSDIVLVADLPEKVLKSAEMYAGCVSGALMKTDYLDKIRSAGFKSVDVVKEDAVCISDYIGSDKIVSELAEDMTSEEVSNIDKAIVSIKVSAKKI